MIKLYTWKTPNGKKPAIMLEELDVPYEIIPVDISKDEQFRPEFLQISPNNKIPAIVDDELKSNGKPLTIFESGAILIYLAEKYHQFLPREGMNRYKALEWTFWQAGGLGPMLGQLGYFAIRSEEKTPHAINRFHEEAERLLNVLDKQLQDYPFIAGKEYTIADMMTYPWAIAATTYLESELGQKIKEKHSVRRWLDLIGNRPAVKRGMNILEEPLKVQGSFYAQSKIIGGDRPTL